MSDGKFPESGVWELGWFDMNLPKPRKKTRLEIRAEVAREIGNTLHRMKLQHDPDMTTKEFLDYIEANDDWLKANVISNTE